MNQHAMNASSSTTAGIIMNHHTHGPTSWSPKIVAILICCTVITTIVMGVGLYYFLGRFVMPKKAQGARILHCDLEAARLARCNSWAGWRTQSSLSLPMSGETADKTQTPAPQPIPLHLIPTRQGGPRTHPATIADINAALAKTALRPRWGLKTETSQSRRYTEATMQQAVDAALESVVPVIFLTPPSAPHDYSDFPPTYQCVLGLYPTRNAALHRRTL